MSAAVKRYYSNSVHEKGIRIELGTAMEVVLASDYAEVEALLRQARKALWSGTQKDIDKALSAIDKKLEE